MKNFVAALFFLAASAPFVVSLPADAAAGVNEAASNGAKVSYGRGILASSLLTLLVGH
jgi:hypothetical protein